MGYLPSAILGSSRVFPVFSFPHCNTRAHLARGEVHPQKFFRALQIFVDPLRFWACSGVKHSARKNPKQQRPTGTMTEEKRKEGMRVVNALPTYSCLDFQLRRNKK